jgi:uncharacterized protein GlcG (DUF336 family)
MYSTLKPMVTRPLETMSGLPLATAKAMVDAGRRSAREQRLAPLGFCILDRAGTIVTAQNEDGGTLLRFELAFAKAWGCLGLGHSTRYFKDVLAKQRPEMLGAVQSISNGRFLAEYGGVLLRDADGEVVGALGVAGAAQDSDDEAVAVAMVAGTGLKADLS